ncbi:hypothetical protein E4P41_18045 [Geodermatophilus sp. DF01-2]|nr:hypothetical protein E4P41_18045 [Geodermatophilus sp. DF01_2]
MTHLDGRRSYDAPVVPAPPVPDPGKPGVLTLSPTGRRARLAATAVVLALLLGGTVWGNDSEFPFGPFRMYSTRADPDRPVVSTRVVGVTADGDQVRLSGGEVGLRRAEFEGQLPRLVDEPELLGLLAQSYAVHHPGAEPLVAVRVVQRRHALDDGRRTGEVTESVLIDHTVAATHQEGTP